MRGGESADLPSIVTFAALHQLWQYWAIATLMFSNTAFRNRIAASDKAVLSNDINQTEAVYPYKQGKENHG
jgi:hypothetical protein